MRALFVCDGAPEVGGGHLMRSLTLAEALAERGWTSSFLTSPFAAAILDRYDRTDAGRLPVEDQRPDTLARADTAGFDAVIVDHFDMSAEHERRLRPARGVLLAVDDLADRAHDADLVVDCNLQRRAEDYSSLAPEAELLLGPGHAPVRREFSVGREDTLRRRSAGEPDAPRLLISLGLTDVGGVTGRVLKRLKHHEGPIEIVVGSRAASRSALERQAAVDERLSLNVEVGPDRMAELMRGCDLAIGAGGSSQWERATLGLPGVTMILADNQAPGARALEAAGATTVLDAREDPSLDGLEAALRRARDHRRALSSRLAALCDGGGAARTAERLTARVQALRS